MAISATSSVLTANDWQYAKDIKPGDIVFNRLGQPVKVKTVQTYRSEDCYRVMFDDYLSVDGDRHLAFPTEDHAYRNRANRYRGVIKRTSVPKIRDVKDLLTTGLIYRKTRLFFSVPTTEPIQLPHQPQGIPPFLYGFWFLARRPYRMMQVPVEFFEKVMQKFKNAGYQVTETRQLRPEFRRFRTNPSIWDQLRGFQTRTLPPLYLNGSPEQRLALLQGIFCARPLKTASKEGVFMYSARKKQTITAIQYLTESLGAKTKLAYHPIRRTNDLRICRRKPFLEEMMEKRPVAHLARRYVKSIEPIPAQLCVHIETDEKDGTFLVGEGFISCH